MFRHDLVAVAVRSKMPSGCVVQECVLRIYTACRPSAQKVGNVGSAKASGRRFHVRPVKGHAAWQQAVLLQPLPYSCAQRFIAGVMRLAVAMPDVSSALVLLNAGLGGFLRNVLAFLLGQEWFDGPRHVLDYLLYLHNIAAVSCLLVCYSVSVLCVAVERLFL